jgi:hypothetical protein
MTPCCYSGSGRPSEPGEPTQGGCLTTNALALRASSTSTWIYSRLISSRYSFPDPSSERIASAAPPPAPQRSPPLGSLRLPQDLIISKIEALKSKLRNANHGNGAEIDVDPGTEEEMFGRASTLCGGTFLPKFIATTETLLSKVMDNPDTEGRAAASLRAAHRLLALGGSACMAFLELNDWSEAMEEIGLDDAYDEFCEDARFKGCSPANFMRALLHGAGKHRSWSPELLRKLTIIVACYYGIKIALQIVLGGSLTEEVADAFGWIHDQNEMSRVSAFSSMWKDDDSVKDGCERTITVVDYDGAEVSCSFSTKGELVSFIHALLRGDDDILRSYSVLEGTDEQLETEADEWVSELGNPNCESTLAPGARAWYVKRKRADGSWVRECGREGWSPYLCDELNRLLPWLKLQFPLGRATCGQRGPCGYPLQTLPSAGPQTLRQHTKGVQAAESALLGAAERGGDAAYEAATQVVAVAESRWQHLDANFEPMLHAALDRLRETAGDLVLALAESFVHAAFRRDQHAVRPEVKGGERLHAQRARVVCECGPARACGLICLCVPCRA